MTLDSILTWPWFVYLKQYQFVAYPETQKLKDSFKNDKAQINCINTKKDIKLLIKEFVFKNGVCGSEYRGPIDQPLKISKEVKANSPTNSADQISIVSKIIGLYFTIYAAIWYNRPQMNAYLLYYCLIKVVAMIAPIKIKTAAPRILKGINPFETLIYIINLH